MIQIAESTLRKHALAWSVIFVALMAYAAPYLLPVSPDSAVFRSGSLSALLLIACAYPIHHALSRFSLRELDYGILFAFIFSMCLGLGSELVVYDGLLPGWGSLIRRLAVPCMSTPFLGCLFSHIFSFHAKTQDSKRIQLPWLAYFALFVLCYGCVLLANFPGILNYDFEFEIEQFFTGEYWAHYPVFHSLLTGWLYSLGYALFGSMTAGAACFSIFQVLCMAAMYATVCRFVQRRLPRWCTFVLTACFALLPFHGLLTISTIKDALFAGLCVLLVIQLWAVFENPEQWLMSKRRALALVLTCTFIGLLRLNGVFAFLPAFLAVIVLCRSKRRRAALLCVIALATSTLTPKGLEIALGAHKGPSSEMMSVPCQQLMRTAEYAPLSEEEYAEINSWFSDATSRYRPHSADPAKGGNFAYERFVSDPGAFWSMYFHYGRLYPRIYLEAFLENCAGIWNPDDVSHSHAMDSEEWDYVYVKFGNIVPEFLGEIEARSYIPALQQLLYDVAHHAKHEQLPFISLLFRPSFYCYLLLLSTLYLACNRRKRAILPLLPIWGITLSLLFSACILVRYAYPIMTATPVLAALCFFAPAHQEVS